MENIFDKLRQDHDVQRELLTKLLETTGDSPMRNEVYKDLRAELTEHAKYEERALYKPMLSIDNTQPKARHSIAEHKEIDDILEKLDSITMSSSHWIKTAKDLDHIVRHHLKEEEHEIFKSAGHAFSKKEKIEQGQDYEKQMHG